MQPASLFSGWRQVAWAAVWLCASVSAHAQPDDWAQLVSQALSSHPDIRAQQRQLEAARADRSAAEWQRFPNVSAEWQARTGGAQSVARVEQTLWSGGRVQAQIEASGARVEQAEATVHSVRMNVMENTSDTVLEVLRFEERLRVSRDSEQELYELVESIRRRVDTEISPASDWVQANARYLQAVSQRTQTQRQLESARNRLTQWVGRPVLGVSRSTWDKRLVLADEGEAVRAALEVSSVRRSTLAELEAAQASIDAAQAQLYPAVVLGHQHTLTGALPGASRGLTYLGVSYEMGAGLSRRSEIEALLARREALRAKLDSYEAELTQHVRTLWTDVASLKSQLEPARQLSRGTTEIVDSYLRQFQVGRRSWLEVLNAQREKAQAALDVVDLEHVLMTTSLRLAIATGVLTPDQLQGAHVQ